MHCKKLSLLTAFAILFVNAVLPTNALAFKELRHPQAFVKIISFTQNYNGFLVPQSIGSGTIISEDGLVLTNNHVVADENNPEKTKDVFNVCVLQSEDDKVPACKYVANLVSRNENMDIALLQIEDKDIFGYNVGEFEFMEYEDATSPDVGDEIYAVGYPSIGDDSLTITKGIVSGYEEANGYQYIKTDTNISPGNSGGAALDSRGELIGIPTFLRYNYEVLGYILDINEAVSWINSNKSFAPQVNGSAGHLLRTRSKHLYTIESTGVLTTEEYPRVEFDVSSGWNLEAYRGTSYTFSRNNSDTLLNITFDRLPFLVNEATIDYTMDKLKETTYGTGNFTKTKTEFQGHEAYYISGTLGSVNIKSYLIPYGYALIGIMTVQDSTETDDPLANISNSFTLLDEVNNTPPILNEIAYTTPNILMKRVDPWYITKNYDALDSDLLFSYTRPDRLQAGISVYYYPMFNEDKNKTVDELREEMIDLYKNSGKSVIHSANVVVDGLQGYALTFSYSKNNKNYTSIAVTLLEGKENYFYFVFSDFSELFDTSINEFYSIMETFRFNGTVARDNRDFNLGEIGNAFNDIRNHRYENEISELKSKQLMKGFDDSTFKPEQDILRVHALKTILEAKRYLDEKDDVASDYRDIQKYADEQYAYLDFADTTNLGWEKPYIRFARDKGIINDGTNYGPLGNIPLAELLQTAYRVFNIETWDTHNDPSVSWTRPIMDKGYGQGFIPAGVTDPFHAIKRGEFAYILSRLMSHWEDKGYWY
jgi:V8-like Glu-specific endopeptidase